MKENFFESTNNKEDVREYTESFLAVPERISKTNFDKNLPKDLGNFLIDKGFIKEIGVLNSWGFMYSKDGKKISIADKEISKENYEYYVFRLGQDDNGEYLFPNIGDETDRYRFLHETNHAYQEYLVDKESREMNIDNISWYNKSVNGNNDSSFSMLFKLCYEIRKVNENKGLSTWGNVPDYNNIEERAGRIAMRALEDSNEMVTMCLWHPKYLETFLNYVSLQIDGYGKESLDHDGLVNLSYNTKQTIKNLIDVYIEEMKNNIKNK